MFIYLFLWTASQKGSEKGEKESDSTKLTSANNTATTNNKKDVKTEHTQTSPEKK